MQDEELTDTSQREQSPRGSGRSDMVNACETVCVRLQHFMKLPQFTIYATTAQGDETLVVGVPTESQPGADPRPLNSGDGGQNRTLTRC